MQPILFWVVGTVSLLAGLLAVLHPRPLRATQGLVALMTSNALILFMLSATVLAIELLVVNLGATAVVWWVLIRPRRMKLGAPGRLRLNVTKFVGFFVALWFCSLVWWAIIHAPLWPADCPPGPGLAAEKGAWTAVFLLGVALVTSLLVVTVRRGDDREEDPR